jgi:DnaK suppressor protein
MSQHQSDNFQALHSRLESLRQELVQRKQRVTRDLAHTEHGLSRNLTEQAVEVQNDETLHAIDTATDVELAEVDEALRRMGEGEYGVCRDCGQPIAPLRLARLPQAVTCAACAR